MGNEVSFQISGDASSAERAWAKILTEQGKLIASLAKSVEKSKELGQSMTSEAKAASMEMAQLERASVAVFERSRTPLERYNKAMDDLRKMREIGLIDTQTYQREMANQNKILDAATGKTAQLEAAQAELAKRQKEAATLTESLRTPHEKAREAVANLTAQYERGEISVETYQRALAREKQILADATGETARLAAQQAELAKRQKEAASLTASLRTPLERARDAVAALTVQHEKGEISTETYRRALAREKQILADATGATERLREAERARIALEREGISVTDKYRTSEERRAQELQRIHALMKEGVVSQETYNRAVKQAGETNKAAQPMFSSLGGTVMQFAGAYISASTAINGFVSAQQEANAEAEAAGKKFDDIFRNLQITAGLTDMQKKGAQAGVLRAAESAGVTSEFAGRTAKQLISSDFSVEQATGSTLKTTLEGLSAATARGQDPAQTVKAMSQFMDALGMDKTEGNAKGFLRAMTNLQSGASEIIDASQIAGKVQGFRGKASQDELLASFEIMRKKTGAENASTALKIFGERLTTVTGSKERMKALKSLGLTAEDVDFQGEDMATILERINTGAEKIKGPKREGVLADLFGTEALPSITGLMTDRGQMGDIIKTMNDDAKYQKSVDIAKQGRNSEANRQEVRRERMAFEEDMGGDIVRNEFDLQMRERGMSGFQRGFYTMGFDAARIMGATPEQAVGFAAPNSILGEDVSKRVVEEAVMAGTKAIDPEKYQRDLAEYNKQQLELMKSIDASLKNRPPVAPPGKPPSSGQGAR